MRIFIKEFLDLNKKLKVLDVGSRSGVAGAISKKSNFTYKRYFMDNLNWQYTGLDIIPGRDVDVISGDLYHYPFDDNSFDVVISGNTMEHVEDIYAWVKELARITNDLVFICVPNGYDEHRHPVDCWRVFPDGMQFILEKIAGLTVVKCIKSKKDTIGVGKKYEKKS